MQWRSWACKEWHVADDTGMLQKKRKKAQSKTNTKRIR